MPTATQIATEQQKEQKLNYLSEQVIGYTAWGKFYGLMRGAAAAGEGLIPHKVCVSADGREIKVYKSDAGKLIGSFLKPVHEYVSKDLSQGNYVQAFLDATTGWFGQVQYAQEQKKATCFDITPKEVVDLVNSSSNYNHNTGQKISGSATTSNKFVDKVNNVFAPETINKTFTTKNILIGVSAITGLILLIAIIKK